MAIALIVGTVVVCTSTLAVGALGFVAGCIVAGSIAAWLLATYGEDIATGSAMVVVQSVGRYAAEYICTTINDVVLWLSDIWND